MFLIPKLGTAQECGTSDSDPEQMASLPWYNNDTFLSNFSDSIMAYSNNPINRVSNYYTIPVKFIVLLAPGETENKVLPQKDFDLLMTTLNDGFASNGMPLRFVMVCPTFVHDVNINVDYGQWVKHLIFNRQQGAINVEIVGNNQTVNTQAVGIYFNVEDAILLERGRVASGFSKTLTHEVGHMFGLNHTHQFTESNSIAFTCLREMVARKTVYQPFVPCNLLKIKSKWCNITGDLLCDTEADPGSFSLATTDVAGVLFTPNKLNYMGNWNQNQRTFFSAGQCGVMMYNFNKRLVNNFSILPNKIQMDAYEFDNADLSARFIAVGETQKRNLIMASNCQGDDKDIIKHRVSKDRLSGDGSGRIGSLFFDIINTTSSGKEFIKSIQIFNTNSAGVRTTQMSQAIVSKDQKHIQVPCSAVKDGDIILIEILRMDDKEGDYTISLTETPQPNLIPSTNVCIGTIFSIENLAGTAEVTWNSFNFDISNEKGETTQLVGSQFNNGILNAFINDQNCEVVLQNEINIGNVPDPEIKKVEKVSSYLNCKEFKLNFVATITGAVRVEWKVKSGPASGVILSNVTNTSATVSGGFITWNGNAGTFVQIDITATNACGVSVTFSDYYNISKPLCNETGGDDGWDVLEITPNPTRGVTTIKMIPKQELNEKVERTVRIYSPITGFQMEQKTTETQIEIDAEELVVGIYYVQVSRDNSITQAVLVVQKE